MTKPVAILPLDSRSWGPAECDVCDSDVEEVLLMSDASIVCPGCLTPVKGLEDFEMAFYSAAPATEENLKKARGEGR